MSFLNDDQSMTFARDVCPGDIFCLGSWMMFCISNTIDSNGFHVLNIMSLVATPVLKTIDSIRLCDETVVWVYATSIEG